MKNIEVHPITLLVDCMRCMGREGGRRWGGKGKGGGEGGKGRDVTLCMMLTTRRGAQHYAIMVDMQ